MSKAPSNCLLDEEFIHFSVLSHQSFKQFKVRVLFEPQLKQKASSVKPDVFTTTSFEMTRLIIWEQAWKYVPTILLAKTSTVSHHGLLVKTL